MRAPLPVRIAFAPEAARSEAWGRLESLHPRRAVLRARTELAEGAGVLLSFELGDEPFLEFPGRVAAVDLDIDGYTRAEVELKDEVFIRRLARTLADVLSRS